MKLFFAAEEYQNDRLKFALNKTTSMSSEDHLRGLLWISAAECLEIGADEQLSVGLEEQDALLVLAAERGALRVNAGDQDVLLSAGQLMMSRSGFQAAGNEISRVWLLAISGAPVGQIMDGRLNDGCFFCKNGLTDVLRLTYWLEQGMESAERLSAEVYSLLMQLSASAERYRPEKGYSLLVQAALGIIQEEFYSLEGIEELAERLEVTSNHLIREFSAAVGIPPGKYLRRRRLECSAVLLTQPDMSVSLAAMLSGFSDANYFTKVFRQEYGVTPRQYRKTHQTAAVTDSVIKQLIDRLVL